MPIMGIDQLNVLVIDDNAYMRTLLAGVLRAIGVSAVFDASSIDAAYRELTLHPIDLIFVDWEMPPDNGLDFVIKVRTAEDSPNPYVPIIMLTGHADKEHVMAARDAGVHEFLAKPVSPRNVYGRLISVLNSSRSFVRVGEYFGPDRRRRESLFEGESKRAGDEDIADDSVVG
jgi:two-component system chemotaxis response regulator CheY